MKEKTAEEVTKVIAEYDLLVPPIYQARRFPSKYELKPLDWALTDEIVKRKNVKTDIAGKETKIRPISTMDIEFLSNEIVTLAKEGKVNLGKHYPCGLNCPGCFSQENVYSDKNNLMYWQEVMDVIDDARNIGLHSIKFLGPGEMFQNPDLFDILDALKIRDNFPISIFTKGAELGDDALATKTFGKKGITSARDLTQRLSMYENVRLLLGFNSFFKDRQDKMVGSLNRKNDYELNEGVFQNRGISDYTEKRNKALVNLVEVGFRDPQKGQRLSLIAAPVGLDQIDEIPTMYLWATLRNMPLVIAPTMESGPKSIGLSKNNTRIDPQHEKLIDMMTKVYASAIENGIMTLDQIMQEGVSAYMGTSACNQTANGLMMRLNGRIQMCPGKSDASAIYGNIHQTPIAEIWMNSPNYKLGALTNNWCTAKTTGMPRSIQDEVFSKLEERSHR